MPRRVTRPGVDDEEWEDASRFGVLVRRANARNLKSKAFRAAVRARHQGKSVLVLRRLCDKMGEPRDAPDAMCSSYAAQWSWASVPMHLSFAKTANVLKEERAVVAYHNTTLKVLAQLLKEKSR